MLKSVSRKIKILSAKPGAEHLRMWPKAKPRPRVDYEADRDYHRAYDAALAATQMSASDTPLRRLRYYSFRYLMAGVRDVPGEVCEVGCYRGLSAYLIAREMRALGLSTRLHVCDSFAGLSDFAPEDRSAYRDLDTPEERARFMCAEDIVRANLGAFDFIDVHKGWVPDCLVPLAQRRFRFVHIDVDLVEPTRDCFRFFYPRLSPNGVMVFDDYGTTSFPGARKAIDACLADAPEALFLATPQGQAFLIKRAQVV